MGPPQVNRQALVIRIFLDFLKRGYEPGHRGLPGLVKDDAEQQLRDKGDPKPELSPRTVQEWLKKAREELARRAKEEKVNLDEPWTMGSLTRSGCDLPAKAVPVVLRVWRYCLANELRFNIREARWVAWLQDVIQGVFVETELLWQWAGHYSDQERACLMLGEPLDSSGLDAALIMSKWHLATARWTGSVTWLREGMATTLSCPAPERFQDGSSLVAAALAEHKMWSNVLDEVTYPELGKTMGELPFLDKLSLSQEAEWVYTHWLRYLHKGPKWQSLSPEEILRVIEQLREWIQAHPWAKDTENIPPMLLFMDDQGLAALPDFKPTELLREVGYEV